MFANNSLVESDGKENYYDNGARKVFKEEEEEEQEEQEVVLLSEFIIKTECEKDIDSKDDEQWQTDVLGDLMINQQQPELSKSYNTIGHSSHEDTKSALKIKTEDEETIPDFVTVGNAAKRGVGTTDVADSIVPKIENTNNFAVKPEYCETVSRPEHVDVKEEMSVELSEADELHNSDSESETILGYPLLPELEFVTTSTPSSTSVSDVTMVTGVTNITGANNIYNIPSVTTVARVTTVPKVTTVSRVTTVPRVTSIPGVTCLPGDTRAPSVTNILGVTSVPGVSSTPDVTSVSGILCIPNVPNIPGLLCTPGITSVPVETSNLTATNFPEVARIPRLTSVPDNPSAPNVTSLPGVTHLTSVYGVTNYPVVTSSARVSSFSGVPSVTSIPRVGSLSNVASVPGGTGVTNIRTVTNLSGVTSVPGGTGVTGVPSDQKYRVERIIEVIRAQNPQRLIICKIAGNESSNTVSKKFSTERRLINESSGNTSPVTRRVVIKSSDTDGLQRKDSTCPTTSSVVKNILPTDRMYIPNRDVNSSVTTRDHYFRITTAGKDYICPVTNSVPEKDISLLATNKCVFKTVSRNENDNVKRKDESSISGSISDFNEKGDSVEDKEDTFGSSNPKKEKIEQDGLSKKYFCSQCNSVFTVAIDANAESCVHCFAVFKRKEKDKDNVNVKISLDGYKYDKPFSCSVCHTSFVSAKSLYHHIELHLEHKIYTCYYCFAVFGTTESLVNHCTIHYGERPYLCNVCFGSFDCRETLECHIKSYHKFVLQLPCVFCPSAFTFKDALREHISSEHENEKTYRCGICRGAFPMYSDLVSHIGSSHLYVKHYSCFYCPVSFVKRENLLEHSTLHFPGKL